MPSPWPVLLSLIVLILPVAAQDCVTECMQRSGCWSGRSVSDPAGCRNMPQLCQIQCDGKKNNAWGAIAYSSKEKTSGWAFEQADEATAKRLALQNCARQGGGKCVVEASFRNSCGAVAADGDIVTWGTSPAKAGAQQRALSECGSAGGKKCAVEASVCSLPNASSAPPATPPPPKATAWGAIAYSSSDMGAGYSQGKADRASAEKEAMTICSQRGKACVLRTAFDKQCGALAADRDFVGLGTSTDQREAMQKAMDDCKKAGGARCSLHIFFCTN